MYDVKERGQRRQRPTPLDEYVTRLAAAAEQTNPEGDEERERMSGELQRLRSMEQVLPVG